MIKINIVPPSTVPTNLTSSNKSVTIKSQNNNNSISTSVKKASAVSLNATQSQLAYGYSAYDLAVANGYKGTIDEWLQSLQGQSPYVNQETNTWWAYTIKDGWYDTNVTVDNSLKQDILISGQNIKTINGQTILGSGNIEVDGGILYQDPQDQSGGIIIGSGIIQDPDDSSGGIVTEGAVGCSCTLKDLIADFNGCLILDCGTSTITIGD